MFQQILITANFAVISKLGTVTSLDFLHACNIQGSHFKYKSFGESYPVEFSVGQ